MKRSIWPAILLLTASLVDAKTILVPDDSSTIQAGINGAASGDTVLVQPGTYYENIVFQRVDIVLASLFLTTGNTNYVSQTIIDGNACGSVVTFYCEYSLNPTVITGFTIQNGLSVRGGGIHCEQSNPVIANNRIQSNVVNALDSTGYGAGIYCRYSQPQILNNIIYGNFHRGNFHSYSGGIYCEVSTPIIEGNYIAFNQSGNVGGGICLLESDGSISGNTLTGNRSHYGGAMSCGVWSSPTVAFNLIYDNDADVGDGLDIFENSSPVLINNVIADNYPTGIFFEDSEPSIVNSIIWGNSIQSAEAADITYCNIQGGYTGTGNIDTDPLFRDPGNGDFHLMSSTCGDPLDSPCIDAGHPDHADLLLSCQWGLGMERADMGAYGGHAWLTTDLDDCPPPEVPTGFALDQNYPNPFNPITEIHFTLPRACHVQLEIFNIVGQKVAILVDRSMDVGHHSASWDAGHMSSGLYLYRLQADGYIQSKKMILLK